MWRCSLLLGVLLAAPACDDGGEEPPNSDDDGTTGRVDSGSSTTTSGTSSTTGTSSSDGTSTDAATSTSGPEVSACEPGGELRIELGHGLTGFEPLDTHPAELIYGVQGGFHIVLGLRARHIDTSDVSVVRFTGTIEGEQLGFTAPYVDLTCAGEHQEALNLLLIWDSTPDVLHGKTARVQAELTDPNGEIFRAEGEVVIDDPQMN